MTEISPIKPNQPCPPEIAAKLTYKIKCPWCEAEPNKPCVDMQGRPLEYGIMHRSRRRDWK